MYSGLTFSGVPGLQIVVAKGPRWCLNHSQMRALTWVVPQHPSREVPMRTMTSRNSRTTSITIAKTILIFIAFAMPSAMAEDAQKGTVGDAIGLLLKQDFAAALKAMRRSASADNTPEAKQLLQELDNVSKMPDICLDYFRKNIGKELSVALRKGAETLRIAGVNKAGQIQAEKLLRVDGEVAGTVPLQLTVADLSVAERMKILGSDPSPDRQIMRGLLAWEAKKEDAAKKCFADSACPLGRALAARVNEMLNNAAATVLAQQRAAAEQAAEKEFAALLIAACPELASQAGVSADSNTLAQVIQAVERKRYTQAQVKAIDRQAQAFRATRAETDYAKAREPVIRRLLQIRPDMPLYVDEATLQEAMKKLVRANPGKEIVWRSSTEENGLNLNLRDNRNLVNISALAGLPITSLDLFWTGVSDLRPLKGMPLESLNLQFCKNVADLTPLKGMRLVSLNIHDTAVGDLRPLMGMPLRHLSATGGDLTALSGLPLESLTLSVVNAMGDCGVTDLRPLRGMPLKALSICRAEELRDLRPLQGMPLTTLSLFRCIRLSDIGPLRGLPLNKLSLEGTAVSDLKPLQGMPLTELDLEGTRVSDLSPLKEITTLSKVTGRDGKVIPVPR